MTISTILKFILLLIAVFESSIVFKNIFFYKSTIPIGFTKFRAKSRFSVTFKPFILTYIKF